MSVCYTAKYYETSIGDSEPLINGQVDSGKKSGSVRESQGD